MNKLLDEKIIEKRLNTLKGGYASCAIEGFHITPEDKDFIEALVKNGLSPDEMVISLKKRMNLEPL